MMSSNFISSAALASVLARELADNDNDLLNTGGNIPSSKHLWHNDANKPTVAG